MVPDFAEERRHMVERQLRRRGIHDQRVLDAMAQIQREEFVPPAVFTLFDERIYGATRLVFLRRKNNVNRDGTLGPAAEPPQTTRRINCLDLKV